jgi:hypothetical protein
MGYLKCGDASLTSSDIGLELGGNINLERGPERYELTFSDNQIVLDGPSLAGIFRILSDLRNVGAIVASSGPVKSNDFDLFLRVKTRKVGRLTFAWGENRSLLGNIRMFRPDTSIVKTLLKEWFRS